MCLPALAVIALMAMIFQCTPASAFSECTSAIFAESSAQETGFVCEQIRTLSFQAMNRTVQVRSVKVKGDTRADQYEPIIMDAVEQSLATFSNYGGYALLKVSDISIVLMEPGIEPETPRMADTDAVEQPNECVMRVFTNLHDTIGTGDVLLDLRNTVAHELFHCVQFATWTPAFVAENSDWWIEGTAELMGHVVYENPTSLTAYMTPFAEQSHAKPITQLSYENVIFFSWLWNRDPSFLFKLLDAMPASGGEAAQRAGLVKAVGDAKLADFVRDYADGLVKTPHGLQVPAPSLEPPLVISGTSTDADGVIPFSVYIKDIAYQNGQYLITTSGKPDVSYKSLDDPSAKWEMPMMISADGPCEKVKTFRFAGMSVATEGDETFTISSQKLPGCEDCVAGPVRDQCLVGTWVMNGASLASSIHEQQPDALDAVTVSGTVAIKFDGQGKSVFGFNKFRLEGKPANSGPAVAFRVDIAGTIDSDWSAESGKLLTCYRGSEAALQISVPGAKAAPMKFADMPMEKSMTYSYQCNGANEAFLTMDMENGKFTFRMDRAQ